MTGYTKKLIILLLSALLAATPVTAYAESSLIFGGDTDAAAAGTSPGIEDEDGSDDITIIPSDANALVLADVGAQSPKGSPGEAITVVLTMAVNREYLPSEKYMLRNITVRPKIPTDTSVSSWPFDIINASYVRELDDMSYDSTADVYYNFRISEFATEGVYPLNFVVNATVWRYDAVNGTSITEDVKFELCVWVTVIGDGGLSGVTTSFGPLQLAGIDDTGGALEAPSAQPGETVVFRVPVVNKGGALTNITVEPVVSPSLDEFPFVAQNASYGRSFSSWQTDGLATLEYTLTVSPYATTGNKSITFRATYYENGAAGECTFNAYIYISNGYEDIPTTAPSLMVTGYELFVGGAPVTGLTAGDDASLVLKLTNNAAYDTVWKNVATLSIADSKLLDLTVGSSDSAYARSIAPGETVALEYHISARGDAETGTAPVSITMTYETWDAVAGKATQNIMIPVSQPMKLSFSEPTAYGTATEGKPLSLSVDIVNTGRAKALNLQMAAGDGLSLAEDWYGGDLSAGSSLTADITVNCSRLGEYVGQLTLLCEDTAGTQYEFEIDVLVNVAESIPAAITSTEPEPEPQNDSWPWWAWVLIALIGVLIIGAAVTLALRLRAGKSSSALIPEPVDSLLPTDDDAHSEGGGP